MLWNDFCFRFYFICSNVQNATNFQHMARMMDSLILNEFPPYTFTKITTTHRPVRTNNGMTTSKLLAKSTANISSATANPNNNNNNSNSSVASVLGTNNGLRQSPLQKTKVPMQGLHLLFSLLFLISIILIRFCKKMLYSMFSFCTIHNFSFYIISS